MKNWSEILENCINNILAEVTNDVINKNQSFKTHETIKGILANLTNIRIIQILERMLLIIDSLDDTKLRSELTNIIKTTIKKAKE